MLLKDGTCQTCPEYSRKQGDGKECGPNTCTDNEKIGKDGKCYGCKKYETANYGDHTLCQELHCKALHSK